LNRTSFVAALAATAAAIVAGPIPTIAAPAAAPAVPALAMWEFSGAPWVVAPSAEAAIATVRAHYAKRYPYSEDPEALQALIEDRFGVPRRMADDEPFELWHSEDSDVPEDLKPYQRDVACECEPANREKWGCECEAAQPVIDMSASEWAQRFGPGKIIWEFEG
jgi:hypothetical protein